MGTRPVHGPGPRGRLATHLTNQIAKDRRERAPPANIIMAHRSSNRALQIEENANSATNERDRLGCDWPYGRRSRVEGDRRTVYGAAK